MWFLLYLADCSFMSPKKMLLTAIVSGGLGKIAYNILKIKLKAFTAGDIVVSFYAVISTTCGAKWSGRLRRLSNMDKQRVMVDQPVTHR